MTDKVIALLGFAAKSGSLVFGVKDCVSAIKKSQAKGIFFATDISAKSRKEILFHCDKFGVRAFELKFMSSEKLTKSVGRKCSAVVVTNNSFNEPIVSYLTSGREEI